MTGDLAADFRNLADAIDAAGVTTRFTGAASPSVMISADIDPHALAVFSGIVGGTISDQDNPVSGCGTRTVNAVVGTVKVFVVCAYNIPLAVA
jgi:hypothetical protein